MFKQKMPLALIHQALAAIVLVASGAAHAQTGAAAYPTKPVKLVVGFAAGGPTDVVARAFADHASRALGQPFIIDNKPGAGTIIASEHVAKAVPDGHTLLLAASSLGIAPSLYSKVNYDPVKDFTPISLLARFQFGITPAKAWA